MNNISIADILELPVQERIRLVELIWDSVAAVPEGVKVSPALRAELEARLAEFEANPEAGYSWDQVKPRLSISTCRGGFNRLWRMNSPLHPIVLTRSCLMNNLG
ncbi:MAG: addiction module protein [Sulfurimicrobium sp.]|nr:addiction module protein [Sulfurimicrobium sp.]